MSRFLGFASVVLALAAPAGAAEAPAQVAAIAINVADLDRSVAFYKLVGLTQKEVLGQKPNRRVQFNMDAPKAQFMGGLSLHEVAGAPALGNGYIRFLVQVDDAAAACKRLADAKMPCAGAPRAVAGDGNAMIATVKDPDGYELQLIQLPH